MNQSWNPCCNLLSLLKKDATTDEVILKIEKELNKQWWASIFRFVRRQVEASLKTTSENHRKKLEKLSERQDKPLWGETTKD